MSEQLTQNVKIMSDEEFKQHLKDLGVVIKNILHSYKFGGRELCCITCDYYLKLCWLCDQCESCCNWSEKECEERML